MRRPSRRSTLFVSAVLLAGLLSVPTVLRGPRALADPPNQATFNYTGASQSWIVPAGLTVVRVDAQGAQGGGTGGGKGGRVQTLISVTPGETLRIYVGGAGGTGGASYAAGGFNGGGNSGAGGNGTAGGGGGASDLRQGGSALANRKVVGGGGGGTSSFNGIGGQCDGVTGRGGGYYGPPEFAGGCSKLAAGGPGGPGGSSGGFGFGGSGGGNGTSVAVGGGGGGGYYGGGGGGGGNASSFSGGGGGGSSFPNGNWLVLQIWFTGTHTAGFRSGNGLVVLSWTNPTTRPDDSTAGTGANGPAPTTRSDPVNTATGAFVHAEADLALPGRGVGFSLARTYNSNDSTLGPLGRGWALGYGASLSVLSGGDVALRAEDGQRVTYLRQPDGTFARPPGVTSGLTAASPDGYVLTRVDLTRSRFDADGRLVSVTDGSGVGLSLAYDSNARLATVTDAAGRSAVFAYNSDGRLVSVSLPDGRAVGFAYQGELLSSATGPTGAVTTYAYDGAGRMNRVTDALGQPQVQNTYDSSGRVVSQLDPLGNVSTFAWTSTSTTASATMTDASGATWTDVYSGNVLQYSDTPAGRLRHSYDAALNPIGVASASAPGSDANWWRSAYDGAGRPVALAAPGDVSGDTWAYDGAGQLTDHTDGRGNRTTYTYDSGGHLLTTTFADGAVETRTYTGAGQVASVVDPTGATTTYGYDSAGNMTSTTDPTGATTTHTYDGAGRVLNNHRGPRQRLGRQCRRLHHHLHL